MRSSSLADRVALGSLLALAAGCASEWAVTPADPRAVRLATALALPTAQSVVLAPSAVTAGATVTGTVRLSAPTDVVRIESAVFKPGGRGGTLTVKATGTNPNAILTVIRGSGREAVGQLRDG
jgi:hypothetical protein